MSAPETDSYAARRALAGDARPHDAAPPDDPAAGAAARDTMARDALALDGPRGSAPAVQVAGAAAAAADAARQAAAARPEASVRRRVLTLAWPAVLEQVLFTFVGLADVYIVGHLGAAAITGVGLGGQVTFLAFTIFAGLGVGSTALVARHVGAGEPDEVTRLAWQSLVVAAVCGALVTAIGLLFAEPIMQLFGADAEVIALGAAWLRVYALSLPLLSVLFIGNAVLRGAGDTRTPLIAMALVNVINVAVAWILVRVLGFGVVGSALGATLGQAAGGLLIGALLWRGRSGVRLAGNWSGLDLARIRRLVHIGLPASAEQLMLQLALATVAIVITHMGTAAYAAHIVTWRLSGIAFLPGWGFAVAANTLVGQELGRRDVARARRSGYVAFWLALAVMIGMGLPLFLFAEPLVAFMTTDPEVIRLGAIALRLAALAQAPMAASFVFSGSLRGAGDTRSTLIITGVSIWGVRLALAYLLGIVFGLGLPGVWLAIIGDFVARGLLFWARFHFGRWDTIRV
jgi:putative MATE family efflux protein